MAVERNAALEATLREPLESAVNDPYARFARRHGMQRLATRLVAAGAMVPPTRRLS